MQMTAAVAEQRCLGSGETARTPQPTTWVSEIQDGHRNPRLGSQRNRMDTTTHVWGLGEAGWSRQPVSGVSQSLRQQPGTGSRAVPGAALNYQCWQ